jgi:hypothetical protein
MMALYLKQMVNALIYMLANHLMAMTTVFQAQMSLVSVSVLIQMAKTC